MEILLIAAGLAADAGSRSDGAARALDGLRTLDAGALEIEPRKAAGVFFRDRK